MDCKLVWHFIDPWLVLGLYSMLFSLFHGMFQILPDIFKGTQHVTGLKVYTILIEYLLLIQAILHKDFPGMYGFFKSPLTLPPNIAVLPTKTSAKIEE